MKSRNCDTANRLKFELKLREESAVNLCVSLSNPVHLYISFFSISMNFLPMTMDMQSENSIDRGPKITWVMNIMILGRLSLQVCNVGFPESKLSEWPFALLESFFPMSVFQATIIRMMRKHREINRPATINFVLLFFSFPFPIKNCILLWNLTFMTKFDVERRSWFEFMLEMIFDTLSWEIR